MLIYPTKFRLFIYKAPTDMRKGFNGLSALVCNELSLDPLSGDLYIFRNKNKNKLKVLYWDKSGYALWYKSLEQGKFLFPDRNQATFEIDLSELSCILDGIDLRHIKRHVRFSLAKNK